MNEFSENGYADYYAGVHVNPYGVGTAAHESWEEGHDYAAAEDEAAQYDIDADDCYWSAVEQGMYDDDPSPYAGDYSEM